MENIFENASFGDRFKTRDGRLAVYLRKIDGNKDRPHELALYIGHPHLKYMIEEFHDDGHLQYDYDFYTGKFISKVIDNDDIVERLDGTNLTILTGIWLRVSDKSVQNWLEYSSENSIFVAKYMNNVYLSNDLPVGIGTIIKDKTAEILILP